MSRALWRRIGPFTRQAGPPTLALLPALWECPLLLRGTPLSYDHAAHLFKAWHFWTEMLGRGRLRGWSHFWAFGFPSDELVPCGSEAWVALFRLLSFGQLSWLHTYALAFGAFLLFKALSAYVFTRAYFGRSAAIACAWIATLDPGAMLEGGWRWHTHWGVWPVTLAVCFALMSLARLERVLAGGGRRDVLGAGSWLAAALLTHQMALPMFALVVPLLVADHWLRRAGLTAPALARALGAVGLGCGLSAFFLVPFLARTSFSQDLGWLGDGLPLTSQHFLELQTFQGVAMPVHALGLLGALFVLRRRPPGGLFLLVSGLLLVLLSSGTLLSDLHLERVLPGLIKLEANRFLLIAKLFWFPLAGYGLIELLRPWLALAQQAGRLRATLGLGAAGALGLALLAPGWSDFYATQVEKELIGESERQYWSDFPALLSWTRELRENSHEHYRIAYEMWRGEHLSTLAPVFDETLMFKVGYTPAQIFDAFPMTGEPELYQKLSVKYVVSVGALKRPGLAFERRFGQLWVYRYEDYRPDPFRVLGAGQGELLELSPERLRIRLSGAEADSRLELYVARFDRWRASYAGTEVPIATVPALGAEYPWLMEVPARDGELVLEYVYRAVDWIGLLVTLLSLPLFGAVSWLEQRDGLATRWAERCWSQARALRWPALGAAALVLVLVALGTRSRARLLPKNSLFRQATTLTLNGQACALAAPLSFRCGDEVVQADLVSGAWGLHLCMTAPDDGELRLSTQTTLGSFLAGSYDPSETGSGSIRVSVDGEELGTLATRPSFLRQQHFRFDTRGRAGRSALVEAQINGSALHCFDLATVD
ncbi:MAG: hypothetical protein RL033_1851 [Pseudomonadota bacterium]|jgi:hypothetical protein